MGNSGNVSYRYYKYDSQQDAILSSQVCKQRYTPVLWTAKGLATLHTRSTDTRPFEGHFSDIDMMSTIDGMRPMFNSMVSFRLSNLIGYDSQSTQI